MVELMQKIEQLNASAEQINAQRTRNLGKKETLEAQCKELFDKYEEVYGVRLTPETLNAEYEKVLAEKAKETALLNDVVTSIQAGRYEHANALMGVKPDETVNAVFNSDDYIKQKQAIEHTNYVVSGASPVTEMGRRAEAVANAQATLDSEAVDTGADFAKVNADVSTPVAMATPHDDIPTPVAPVVAEEEVIPRVPTNTGMPVMPKAPVMPIEDEEDVIPAPKMTKQTAPIDALEGFTMPQQTAPQQTAPSMFDSVASAKPQAHSFAEMFGASFSK